MKNKASSPGRGKKILPAILIIANLIMLAVCIVTIPPNIRAMAEAKKPAASGAEYTAPADSKGGELTSEDEDDGNISAGGNLPTVGRPKFEEFYWYTDDVMENGVPWNADIIDNVKYVLGGWKGLIIYDPENNYGDNSAELVNVTIEGDADNLIITLDWYMLLIPGDTTAYDETDVEDIEYEGEWIGGGIDAFGWGELKLRRLYDLDSRQYAIGSLDTPDGTPALVALVRP